MSILHRSTRKLRPFAALIAMLALMTLSLGSALGHNGAGAPATDTGFNTLSDSGVADELEDAEDVDEADEDDLDEQEDVDADEDDQDEADDEDDDDAGEAEDGDEDDEDEDEDDD